MDRLVALAIDRRYLMVGMFDAVFIGGPLAFETPRLRWLRTGGALI
jgi:hypothetical protein